MKKFITTLVLFSTLVCACKKDKPKDVVPTTTSTTSTTSVSQETYYDVPIDKKQMFMPYSLHSIYVYEDVITGKTDTAKIPFCIYPCVYNNYNHSHYQQFQSEITWAPLFTYRFDLERFNDSTVIATRYKISYHDGSRLLSALEIDGKFYRHSSIGANFDYDTIYVLSKYNPLCGLIFQYAQIAQRKVFRITNHNI